MTMDYVAWAEWYDIFYAAADPGDIDFYHGLCKASGGPILEIGVGTGRIALPLAQQGMESVGIELFEPIKEEYGDENSVNKRKLLNFHSIYY